MEILFYAAILLLGLMTAQAGMFNNAKHLATWKHNQIKQRLEKIQLQNAALEMSNQKFQKAISKIRSEIEVQE